MREVGVRQSHTAGHQITGVTSTESLWSQFLGDLMALTLPTPGELPQVTMK